MQVSFVVQIIDVNEAAFKPLPVWFIGVAASVVALIFTRRWGRKVTPASGRFADFMIDLAVLLCAASIVASVSSTTTVSTLIASIDRNIDDLGNEVTIEGFQIAVGLLMTIILGVLAYMYTKSESGVTLFWFALLLQVAALGAPMINEVLEFWVNYPIRWLWNGLMWVLNFLPSIQINF